MTTQPLRPDKPLLEQLSGMAEARAWGEALKQDLDDYRAGRIAWSEVDPGLVLEGEPGTGKTTFVTALAATCKVPLIATSYAEWQRSKDGHLGDVLGAMHNAFKLAKKHAPCILFIDEIEAVSSRKSGGNNERWYTGIITALNEELHGIFSREGVVVVAATNHSGRIDPALLRPGRLDTRIIIPMPKAKDLEGIARFHLRGKLPDADLSGLGVALVGLTGAHVEKLVRVARRRARKLERELLLDDLFAVLGEKLAELPREYLERIAVHEAGHAVAAIVLDVSRNVGISLFHLAEGSASTYFDPQVEAVTRKVVERRIEVALAGRAAEQVLLGDVTAGATSDLEMANNLAFSAVARWGLSDLMRPRWFGCGPEQIVSSYPALADEAHGMLDVAHRRALALVRRRAAQVWSVAGVLLKRRALPHDDIVALLARGTHGQKGAARRSAGPRSDRGDRDKPGGA
jgi:cell division protease FtsH